MNKQNRKEIIIVSLMVIVAAIIILVMRNIKGGSKVVVTVGGEEYGTYNLNKNQEIEILSANGINILKIEDGEVRVISASCPDQICVNMSPLKEDMIGLIVCLPNEVVIELNEE